MEQWRVFCAIELSSVVRSGIQKHVDFLRHAAPEVQASWSRIENIHLTIKFFGSVATDRVPLISTAASRTASSFHPFTISISKAGVFPRMSQPRVVWIGVDDRKAMLAELQQRFELECSANGFEKETRSFSPHLTIARIRKPAGARALAEANQQLGFEPESLLVEELVVFRSELSSGGSKYTALSRHPLGSVR
ncbi:MAG TPA: RNA 2',3'-cyclic phosphodiesterase [Pyrinomonadaceae bacterium]|jgi:2''-5'' RNA ligase|nr:RNA 2',3'-cyclic phosphodiesterase [Pyrinomonadaceae bacterium]